MYPSPAQWRLFVLWSACAAHALTASYSVANLVAEEMASAGWPVVFWTQAAPPPGDGWRRAPGTLAIGAIAGFNLVVVAGKIVASNSGLADVTQQRRMADEIAGAVTNAVNTKAAGRLPVFAPTLSTPVPERICSRSADAWTVMSRETLLSDVP